MMKVSQKAAAGGLVCFLSISLTLSVSLYKLRGQDGRME